MAGMNPAILNLVVSLGLMQVARRLPLDHPEALQYLRIGYAVSQLLQFAVCYYLQTKVKSKNDLTTIKYVAPKTPGSQDQPKLVTTTVRDYDLEQISQQMRSILIGIAMIGVMHVYFKYTQPLFIQALMPLKSLYDNNEVKIHIFGKPATGELARPFKVASMFGGVPETDKATIAQAEKTSGAVKKDL